MPECFGIHTINCTYHPYGEWPLEYTETLIDEAIGGWSAYSQFMDSHLGLWTNELSTYVTRLEEIDWPMIQMRFNGNNNYQHNTYYSVMIEACAGYFIELITDSTSGLNLPDYKYVDEPRLDFTSWSTPATTYDSVVKVSRATTKLDEMIEFYTVVVGGSIVMTETLDDGTEWVVVTLDEADDTQIHFVNRPAAES